MKTQSADRATFHINTQTGAVTLNVSLLDYEVKAKYDIYVVAVDSISSARGAEAHLVIDLVDINDNSPVFSQLLYTVSVDESTTIGTSVLKVTATDRDRISADKIVYSLLKNDYSELFSIASSSGDIRVAKSLVYKGVKKFILTVCANDMTDVYKQNVLGMCFCVMFFITNAIYAGYY